MKLGEHLVVVLCLGEDLILGEQLSLNGEFGIELAGDNIHEIAYAGHTIFRIS